MASLVRPFVGISSIASAAARRTAVAAASGLTTHGSLVFTFAPRSMSTAPTGAEGAAGTAGTAGTAAGSSSSSASAEPSLSATARRPPHRSHVGVNLDAIVHNIVDPTVTHAAIEEGGSTLPDFAATAPLLKQMQEQLSISKILADPSEFRAPSPVEAEARKLEIDDPKLIFESAWKNLLENYGLEKLTFPSVIIYFTGAPGAGKGSVSGELLKQRDLSTSAIFEVSSLLNTPVMKAKKEAGVLIGDKEVVLAVLEELLKDRYRNGAVVDGYPRTRVQAECIRLLHDKLTELWNSSRTNPALRSVFKRPKISIACLYVDESESIRRQMKRGKELLAFNKMVSETGVGNLLPVRATDVSEEAAKKRYLIFKEEIFASLQAIKDKFPFHFIDAGADLATVSKRISQEFSYQSSQDLQEEAYELIRKIDSAREIIRSARSNMVARLNSYAIDYKDLFERCLDLVASEFSHILKRQSLTGVAIIRSQNPLLESPIALNMVLDVLAERGFTVVLDVVKVQVPSHIDPIVPGDPAGPKIICRTEKTFVFRIEWQKPSIQRNE